MHAGVCCSKSFAVGMLINYRINSSHIYCVDCAPLAIQAKSEGHKRVSSAKIRMILELLQKINERSAGEKTIIFSQFTSMLDVIGPFLQDAGVDYVRCPSQAVFHKCALTIHR